MAGCFFTQMKNRLFATISLLIIILLILCGCFSQPYVEQTITSNKDVNQHDKPAIPTRTLYVSGAVQVDGFVTVPQICDYKTVLDIVGVTDYSVLPVDITSPIGAYVDALIINYSYNGASYSSVNVNGALVTSRLSIDGVDDSVVNKLADYIQSNGIIVNRNQLKLALSDDYDDNYYKFYIDRLDYAQDS